MPRLRHCIGAALAAAAIAAAPGAAAAAASPWWETEHGAVRLIAATSTVGTEEEVELGLHFRMIPGWKIYWRSPGDAGFPPRPDWTGSENLSHAELAWPAPERFSVLGLETLGYRHEVVLPLRVALERPGAPLRLRARVSYLTCDDICVPYDAELVLELPAGPQVNTPEAGLIADFAARVPPPAGPGAPLRIAAAEVAGTPERPLLLVRATAEGTPFVAPDLYVEGPARFGFAKPEAALADDRRSAMLSVAVTPPRGDTAPLAGRAVTFTLLDGARAVEQRRTVAASLTAPPSSGPGLLVILGLAVLGGLILNLMPCVLPVLSLKLMGALRHGGAPPSELRRGFLATAAGILVSFLALASGAVALKLSGRAVGWGVQFQEPLFLAAMAAILVLFAANLWGRFAIPLPGTVADAAHQAGGGRGLGGHFLTGAFATLLATPCSAPFLGTAVGFALSRGAAEIYAVFAALGLGLALPYLAVAAAPGLARLLPRPGPWMVGLRRGLGVLLIATAAWLVSVMAAQTGWGPALAAAGLLAAGLAALWRLPVLAGTARAASWAVAAVLGAAALGAAGIAGPPAPAAVAADALWRPFDRAAIARDVALGRVVLVDVTADWCLTCQVNKRMVLDRDSVRARLAAPGTVAMQADWTRPDPAIAAYLGEFGRYGIPFNAVYGPGRPGGEALPELLTVDAVERALDRAAGGT